MPRGSGRPCSPTRRGRRSSRASSCPRTGARCRVATVTLVVITGATRGIGRAAAIELAGKGAEVVVIGRERARVDAVAGAARAAGGGAPVHTHVADMTLMAEVRALADELRERHERIDVLANNAGALFASRQLTSEGL